MGFLTYIWSGTFTSPTVIGSPRSTCFPDIGQPSETWRLGYYLWVARPCLSESFCIVLYKASFTVLHSGLSSEHGGAGTEQQDQEEHELERWICACGLWDSDLGDLFLNYLQAGASLRGNFEFLLPRCGKLEQLLFWSKICYKIVRRLFSYRAVYFYDRLRTFFRQPSQAYLETIFLGKIFHFGTWDSFIQG